MAITGYFTRVEIPTEVQVGMPIPLRVGFHAKLPGAKAWATCIMAKMGTNIMIVKVRQSNPLFSPDTITMEDDDYNLFPMPSTKQTIYVRLLGHGTWGHNWTIDDWNG